MRTYTDGFLNHWADVYVELGVKRYHITLDQFLAQPEQMVARVRRFQAAGQREVEPVQHHRERRESHSLRQRGDLLMQKLWHGSRRRNRADSPLPSRR